MAQIKIPSKKNSGSHHLLPAKLFKMLKPEKKTWDKIPNGDLGSNFSVGFSNDRATSKTITGLKVSRNKILTLQDFNQIQDGQSREEVFNTLDTPNEYSESKSVIRIVK